MSGELARGIAQIELRAAGLVGGDAQAAPFPCQEDDGVFCAEGQGFCDGFHRINGSGAVEEGGDHRAGGPQDIKHHTYGLRKIARGEGGKLSRTEQDFKCFGHGF